MRLVATPSDAGKPGRLAGLDMTAWALSSLALASGLLCSFDAQAALVAEWNMTGRNGLQLVTPGGVATGLTGGTWVRGSGLIRNSGPDSMSASGWDGGANDYLGFTVTVEEGSALFLDRLSIGTRSSSSGPGSIGLFYSGDLFANALATVQQGPGNNVVYSVMDLSALPALTSGSLEFRLYQIGANAADGGATSPTSGSFRITDYFSGGVDRNITLEGAVVTASSVPVPAAGWLLLLGLGALVTRIPVARRHLNFTGPADKWIAP